MALVLLVLEELMGLKRCRFPVHLDLQSETSHT